MKLTIDLEFNPQDSAEVVCAVTKEHAALSLVEFTHILGPAIALIHHNLQAYLALAKERPDGVALEDEDASIPRKET